MVCNVINRDERTDRWTVVEKHLKDNGFNPIRFSAIEGGWRGCRDSHLWLLFENRKYKYTIIFEDDIEFLVDDPIPLIYQIMDELPLNFDALYLGASPQEPFEWYTPHLFKMGKAFCTHATIWHNRKGGAVEYILNHVDKIDKIDVFFSDYVYPDFNCYLSSPMIASQRQTQSDCCKRSDLSTLVTNYKKYCI